MCVWDYQRSAKLSIKSFLTERAERKEKPQNDCILPYILRDFRVFPACDEAASAGRRERWYLTFPHPQTPAILFLKERHILKLCAMMLCQVVNKKFNLEL